MPSPFAKLMSVAAATHDRVFGDEFEYRPMKALADLNAPRGTDPDRANQTFFAPFGEAGARAMGGPFREPGVQPGRAQHAQTRPFISLDLSRLPYAPEAKDQIYSAEKATLFEIAEIVPSQVGFVRLDLNILSGKG
jgi:hypothetical protein